MRRLIFDRSGAVLEHTLHGIAQPLAARPGPLPASEWPMWAKALKLLSTPDDKGIGDVVARIIGDEKSVAFKTWFRATFNSDCGCDGREAQWNRQYPLNE